MAVALAVGVLLAVTACSPATSSGAVSAPIGDAETAVPHGYVEGASELQEPALRLVAASDGTLTALDPATEQTVRLADVGAAAHLATDGRYVAASGPDGLTLVDGAAWTVPHGDHSHYYLAEPRVVAEPGDLDGGPGAEEARIASSASVTAVTWPGSGRGVLLDGDALGDGELVETGRVEGTPHDSVLVPLGDVVVASVVSGGGGGDGVGGGGAGSAADEVRVYTAEGETVDGARASCEGLRGAAPTRVGVVVGCADGAVLVTESEGSDVGIERIPYPEGTPASDVATSFEARPGRPAVAAVAGTRGAWLLDVRARTWTLVATPEPLLRATAVGDSDDTVVGVDASGRVVVSSPEGLVAQTEPLLAGDLVDGALPAGVQLEVDVARSYVNSPASGLVHEIDHADAARVARSLELPADLLVETGR
ncbi:hypothetical protein EDF38_0491 [Frigoribacterium sp. PhB160]|uniref:ABC transporter n=1 Tax=Frigoribacterium sp. PhB160 TaxID=2485192 RepID=UPI000F48CBA1|nr:ABC transporter [Frigoribacterium sp. PhB160]ROS61401.1 hypothetical protein EDF38_0491 [Frigoribacterium sp. PhB160]